MDRLDRMEKMLQEVILMQKNLSASQDRTDAQLAKTDAQLAKTDAQLAKTDAQMARSDIKLERAAQLLGNMGMNLGSVAEDFFYEALNEKKALGNIKFDEIVSNIKTKLNKTQDEFDIVMYNGNSVGIIEIKHKVHPSDLVKLYTKKLDNFKLLYPTYRNHKIYLGIAGFSVPSIVEAEAHKRGIAVLKQKADIAVIEAKNLKAF